MSTNESERRLLLPSVRRTEVEEHALRGYPHEVCGLLVGRVASDGTTEVLRVHPARNLNLDRARDRYELDPRDQLAAEEAARAADLSVVGVYHSHPDHPARPSETDRAAAWPGWSYLIVSVGAQGAHDLRSYRLDGEVFVEEAITHEIPR